MSRPNGGKESREKMKKKKKTQRNRLELSLFSSIILKSNINIASNRDSGGGVRGVHHVLICCP